MNRKKLIELQKKRDELDRQIQNERNNVKKELIASIREQLAEHGLSWEDLPLPTSRRPGMKASLKHKFRNPSDPSMTWSGRGRAPKWVLDHEAAGGSREDLAV